MKRNRNCPGAATPGQRMEQGGIAKTTISKMNDTMLPAPIASFLSAGRENALPLRQLKLLTGLDGRTVRQMIQRERLEGVPILSDNQTGYFLPADEAERIRFVRSMRHRAKEIFRVADAVERKGGEW